MNRLPWDGHGVGVDGVGSLNTHCWRLVRPPFLEESNRGWGEGRDTLAGQEEEEEEGLASGCLSIGGGGRGVGSPSQSSKAGPAMGRYVKEKGKDI